MMKTTKQQDIIISRMSDYTMILNDWNEITKDIPKPIWVGEGAKEEIRSKYHYLDKYEYALDAVLEAFGMSVEDAEKLYSDFEKSSNTHYKEGHKCK